jgi:hypothetical protein
MERCRIKRGKDGIIKKVNWRYVKRIVNEKINNLKLKEKGKFPFKK